MTLCCRPCRPATLLLLSVFLVTLHPPAFCTHAQRVDATPSDTPPISDQHLPPPPTGGDGGDAPVHDADSPLGTHTAEDADATRRHQRVDATDVGKRADERRAHAAQNTEHAGAHNVEYDGVAKEHGDFDDDDDDDDDDDGDDDYNYNYDYDNGNDDGDGDDDDDDDGDDGGSGRDDDDTESGGKSSYNDLGDDEHAYMAFFKSEDLGTDQSAITVRINGIPARDVHLHNSTMLSFRVPVEVLQDRALFSKAYVDIHLASMPLAHIPLSVLENAITRVNVSQFRLDVAKRPLHPSSSAPHVHDSATSATSDVNDDDDSDKFDDAYDDGGDAKSTAAGEDGGDGGVSSSSSGDVEEATMASLIQQADILLSENKGKKTRLAISLLERAHAAGNATATTTLASLYLTSRDGLSRNLPLAAELLQNASAKGFPDAQALLGFLHASGFAAPVVPVHVGAAILLWTVAAEGGSTIAKMALAFRHFTGTDVAEDCDKAVAFYEEVANEVFDSLMQDPHPPSSAAPEGPWFERDPTGKDIRPPRPNTLVRGERNRLSRSGTHRSIGEAREVVQYYRHSADRGDAWAQMVMGTLYYYGEMEIPQDSALARKHFARAAKAGRNEAHAIIGFIDLREGRIESALQHLKRGAEQTDRLGLHGMGYMMLRGIGVPRDAKKAASYFNMAAEKMHPESMYNLAVLHAKGVGVPQSAKKSFELLQQAARYGHVLSSYKLGIMLRRGLIPAERNCQKAGAFLKRVAQDGMWGKVLWRALRSYERSAYGDALMRYLLAAHVGLDVGQYNAAFLYEHGLIENAGGYGTAWLRGGATGMARLRALWGSRSQIEDKREREDMTELAMELYLMSGSQGTSEAMVRIGDLAFGERRDYKRAAWAYERAVKERNAEAMFNLGVMHARGFGMNPDRHMAKRYFDLAKDADDDAYLPATIALVVLRSIELSKQMWQLGTERVSVWRDVVARQGLPKSSEGVAARVKDGGGAGVGLAGTEVQPEQETWWGKLVQMVGVVDAVVVMVLMVVLAAVVNARQRRLIVQAGERVDMDGDEGVGVAEVQAVGAERREGLRGQGEDAVVARDE